MWSLTKLAVDSAITALSVESDRHALNGVCAYALALRNTADDRGHATQFFNGIGLANVIWLHQLKNWD
jgi:hypothetical protein